MHSMSSFAYKGRIVGILCPLTQLSVISFSTDCVTTDELEPTCKLTQADYKLLFEGLRGNINVKHAESRNIKHGMFPLANVDTVCYLWYRLPLFYNFVFFVVLSLFLSFSLSLSLFLSFSLLILSSSYFRFISC